MEIKSSFVNENPLQLPDTLFYIFEHLDCVSLKNCRLVCKLWKDEATKHLFKNNCLGVPSFVYDIFSISNVDNSKNKNLTISQVKQFIQTIPNRKIPHLSLNDHRDTIIFNLLDLFWNEVKTLKCKYNQNEIEQQAGVKVSLWQLLNNCRNLKFLELPSYWSTYKSNLALIEILFGIQNLQKNHQNLTISNLLLTIVTLVDIKKFEDFANSGISLEKFGFYPWISLWFNPKVDKQLSHSLEKILESSKNTMTQFCLLDELCLISPGFKIPRMSRLDFFYFWCDSQKNHYQFKFPPDFQFQLNFPKLQTVCLNLGAEQHEEDFWTSMFHNLEPTNSVKSLSVTSGLEKIPDKILQTFPEIEMLETFGIGRDAIMNYENVFDICKRLKHLKFYIRRPLQNHENENENNGAPLKFLASLSGFSIENIEMMLKSKDEINLLDFEALRMNKSILDLPELNEIEFLATDEEQSYLFEFNEKYLPFLMKAVLKPKETE